MVTMCADLIAYHNPQFRQLRPRAVVAIPSPIRPPHTRDVYLARRADYALKLVRRLCYGQAEANANGGWHHAQGTGTPLLHRHHLPFTHHRTSTPTQLPQQLRGQGGGSGGARVLDVHRLYVGGGGGRGKGGLALTASLVLNLLRTACTQHSGKQPASDRERERLMLWARSLHHTPPPLLRHEEKSPPFSRFSPSARGRLSPASLCSSRSPSIGFCSTFPRPTHRGPISTSTSPQRQTPRLIMAGCTLLTS